MGDKLITIEIETSQGSIYAFPDIGLVAANNILKGALSHGETLQLLNVSHAFFQIPWRIVNVIRVEGEERWRRA